ncbi:hypothetical protein V1512DRAFT_252362 [Lipomyces arxii]|uniref:uncharacterized protein n=1 Tax=Lipomyces arxii TaxID=56418 RepID=UPI0034CD71CA
MTFPNQLLLSDSDEHFQVHLVANSALNNSDCFNNCANRKKEPAQSQPDFFFAANADQAECSVEVADIIYDADDESEDEDDYCHLWRVETCVDDLEFHSAETGNGLEVVVQDLEYLQFQSMTGIEISEQIPTAAYNADNSDSSTETDDINTIYEDSLASESEGYFISSPSAEVVTNYITPLSSDEFESEKDQSVFDTEDW